MTTTTTIPSGQISELVRYFLRLGFERRWLAKEQMREAIAICQPLLGLNEIGAISTH